MPAKQTFAIYVALICCVMSGGAAHAHNARFNLTQAPSAIRLAAIADSDDDGLPDTWEQRYGLDPYDSLGSNGAQGDPDSDGLSNAQEFALNSNPRSGDTDGDPLPDGWEVQAGLDPSDATGDNGSNGDPDADALRNAQEFTANTSPQVSDTDSDGLPDGWEVKYAIDPLNATGSNGGNGDLDQDELTNAQEFTLHTNPRTAHSDGDGLPDSWEVTYGLDPTNATNDSGAAGDPDYDGLTNIQEYVAGTSPRNDDTDEDALGDLWEVMYGLNGHDPTGINGAAGDPDGDGLSNVGESVADTDPWNADTDGDGLSDRWEVDHGGDPRDPND